MLGAGFREVCKKYFEVAAGIPFTVSTTTIALLYVAKRNNVDVESIFKRYGFDVPNIQDEHHHQQQKISSPQANSKTVNGFVFEVWGHVISVMKRNQTAEVAASSGGALAAAFLCHNALFPVRAPITLVLTPPVLRFLARRQSRQIFGSSVWFNFLIICTSLLLGWSCFCSNDWGK